MTGTERPIRARANDASEPRHRHCDRDCARRRKRSRARAGRPTDHPRRRDRAVASRKYTQPLLRAAGLAQQNIRVVIINDRSFNAFVADGRRIFVNAGALMDSDTPNQIIGVLSHETGHIAGGHLARLREQWPRRRRSRSSP